VKVLCINSYAGSITLGALSLGADVVGSYEDDNYFLACQKANFPNLNYISYRKDWPKQDLSDTIVCAHPPCSAFSVQNNSRAAKGPDSKAFACTKHVLDYAMGNHAKAIAIESVMGALGGAWSIHQSYADKYGYHLYRILENGCMFGAQWRERFWALWIKKGVAAENINLTITPRFQTVQEVVEGHEDGLSAGNQEDLVERQRERFRVELNMSEDELDYYFDNPTPDYPFRVLGIPLGELVYQKRFKKPGDGPEDKQEVIWKYVGGFGSGGVNYLDPNGCCGTVMGGSLWILNGRCVSENAFKVLMGFPASYIFPEVPKNYRKNMRTGLSKGVMPPISRWILEQTAVHLGQADGLNLQHQDGYTLTCEPDQIADFRIRKEDWTDRDVVLPPLRQFDDQRPLQKKIRITLAQEAVLTPDQRTVIERAKDVLAWCANVPELQDHEEWRNLGIPVLQDIDLLLNPPEPVVPIKLKAPKTERPPKPERVHRNSPMPRGRLSDVRVEVNPDFDPAVPVPGLYPVGGVALKKRDVIITHVTVLGQPTHDETIEHCYTELGIFPKHVHWHIRQLVKQGRLREVSGVAAALAREQDVPLNFQEAREHVEEQITQATSIPAHLMQEGQ
jgi:site-specific DNA-cytosine methylase